MAFSRLRSHDDAEISGRLQPARDIFACGFEAFASRRGCSAHLRAMCVRQRPNVAARQSASAPVSPVVPRRVAGGMRRSSSSHEIIQLSESAPYMAAGWCFDHSKRSGHVVATQEGLLAALRCCACSLLPSSNEFWNVLTECADRKHQTKPAANLLCPVSHPHLSPTAPCRLFGHALAESCLCSSFWAPGLSCAARHPNQSMRPFTKQ